MIDAAGCAAEDYIHPVVRGAECAGREQVAGPVGVDAVAARRRCQRAADVRGREVVSGVGVMAVAMEARHIGCAGSDRNRIAERYGLPATTALASEGGARQQCTGAAP